MTRATSVYARIRNETASKERLMVLLFETAVRHMRLASAAYDKRDQRTAESSLSRASAIVTELLSTLDKQRAPHLYDNLSSVYLFVASRLIKARLARSSLLVREAERAFAPIADAFAQALRQLESGSPVAQAAGVAR